MSVVVSNPWYNIFESVLVDNTYGLPAVYTNLARLAKNIVEAAKKPAAVDPIRRAEATIMTELGVLVSTEAALFKPEATSYAIIDTVGKHLRTLGNDIHDEASNTQITSDLTLFKDDLAALSNVFPGYVGKLSAATAALKADLLPNGPGIHSLQFDRDMQTENALLHSMAVHVNTFIVAQHSLP